MRLAPLPSIGYVRTRFSSVPDPVLDDHLISPQAPEQRPKYSFWKHLLGSTLTAFNGFASGNYKMGLGSTATAILGIALESTFLRTGSNKKEN